MAICKCGAIVHDMLYGKNNEPCRCSDKETPELAKTAAQDPLETLKPAVAQYLRAKGWRLAIEVPKDEWPKNFRNITPWQTDWLRPGGSALWPMKEAFLWELGKEPAEAWEKQ